MVISDRTTDRVEFVCRGVAVVNQECEMCLFLTRH